jgi:hypothetical protein
VRGLAILVLGAVALTPILGAATAPQVAAAAAAARAPARSVSALARQRSRLARDIRGYGRRIQGDLRRALQDYGRLPETLSGLRRGGLTARQRSVDRARTDAVGPLWDLKDAVRSEAAIVALVRRLRNLHAVVHGLQAQLRALQVDLVRLEALSVEVGQSTDGLNAMARFARLLEENRATLVLGRPPSQGAMRGMASALSQAQRDMSALRSSSDGFLRVERAYVALGQTGFARLRSGRLGTIAAISLEMRARGLKGQLLGNVPAFQHRIAGRMAQVTRRALALARRIEHSRTSRA